MLKACERPTCFCFFNYLFINWQDLKDHIDHSIEDEFGKKAKDYAHANPELKRILEEVEDARGFRC